MRTPTVLNLRHAPMDIPVCGKTAETEFWTNVAFRNNVRIRQSNWAMKLIAPQIFDQATFQKCGTTECRKLD
ncbi:hypothetical protein CLV88_11954 [Shimia abyssi]|uniref:Uncharacterized protein n=1 Tax=Shimia abyssi TaxID=1662395 RepID=A0A2P8F6D0_9RHOB|nr:hypothetical protein CLV88_11954 [Shimia abyssi]